MFFGWHQRYYIDGQKGKKNQPQINYLRVMSSIFDDHLSKI